MGLFNNYNVLGRIANAHDAAYRCFDTYEEVYDITCLKTAAWFIKAGVIDLADKHRISPSQPLMGKMVRSTVGFTATSSIRTLSIYMNYLDKGDSEYLQDIIDGGKAFYEVESEVPSHIKKKYGRV